MSLTLYELGKEEQELQDLVRSRHGEITPEDEERWSNLSDLLSDKIDSYYKILKNLDALAEGQEKEADNMAEKARKTRAQIDWLEGSIKYYMESNDFTSLTTPRTEFKIIGVGGVAPVIIDGDVPDEFCVFEVKIKYDGSADPDVIGGIADLVSQLEAHPDIDVKLSRRPSKSKLRQYAKANEDQAVVRLGDKKTRLVY